MEEFKDNSIQASKIAKDILELSRNSLLVNFRYMDRAITNLKFEQDENFTLETDGESLFFDPWFILSQYKAEPNVITRDVLHSYLHCIFCHSFIGMDVNHLRWDFACDIAVENIINDLDAQCIHVLREKSQASVISLLKNEIGTLTAERIYKWIKEKEISDEEIALEREKFKGDGHGLWYGESDPNAKQDRKVKLRKIWEEVSKRMQVELETVNRDEGALVQNLRSLNRSKRSYTDFLKRFTVYGEVMKISDDEFDNNYYIYGLETYGNMPLIEMLEYSEQKRIREFAIAIDTSGSVKGEVVQKFIEHTYNILMHGEDFFTKINVYIIQCDYKIRDVALVTCREDFEKYIETLEIKGLESTDFRPVFEFIDGKIRDKELKEFKGLLYFTDGQGIFPSAVPKYETAFVLNRTDYDNPGVPSWAMHITIPEDNILDGSFSA